MSRLSLFLMAMIVASILLFLSIAHAVTVNCDVPQGEIEMNTVEVEFLVLINQLRAENGAGPLVASTHLNRAAAWMGKDLTSGAAFSHTDSLGRSPSQRMHDCGRVDFGGGENLAGGFSTAQGVRDAWISSPGHRANMLNSSYRQIGISRYSGGLYAWVWVTDFAVADDGTNALTPTQSPATATKTATGTSTPLPPASATSSPTRIPSATPAVPYQQTQFCRRPSLRICVIAFQVSHDG